MKYIYEEIHQFNTYNYQDSSMGKQKKDLKKKKEEEST
jgi:hypothetical protein